MARLACCLMLISLCLCLVLEPTLAFKKGPRVLRPKRRIAPIGAPIGAPVGAPFPSADPSAQVLAQQLCQDTRKAKLCRKVVQGGKVDPVTEAKIIIDISSSMASRVGAFMSGQLKANRVKAFKKGVVEACNLNYENAVVALKLSYINFETNTNKAIESLKEAENKIGLCSKSLKMEVKGANIPPVHKASLAIKNMIHRAQSIAKEQAH